MLKGLLFIILFCTILHNTSKTFINCILRLDIGSMIYECNYCEALKWENEQLNCCGNGRYVLPRIPDPPLFVRKLLTGRTGRDTFFRLHPRAINTMFAMASMGIKNRKVKFKNNFPLFKIHGMIHHRIGHLKVSSRENAQFAQVYMFDPHDQLTIRTDGIVIHQKNVSAERKKVIQEYARSISEEYFEFLSKNNIFVQQFSNIRKIIESHNLSPKDLPNLCLRLEHALPNNVDARVYSQPSRKEVAIVILDSDNSSKPNRDIILRYEETSKLIIINETHRMYDPLHYVLMLPFGTNGWGYGLRSMSNMKVSMHVFYRYHLMVRRRSFNGMHRFGVLFQQYCVDNWAKIQQNNLNFLYFNQSTLHASKYRNVQNRFLKGKSLDHAGYKLLPSSSYGTPRWLDQHCADSLSIVRHFGYVDYFITMTANRNWPEVRNALFLNNSSIDRADIVTRIFNLKVQVCDSDSLLH